VLAPSDFVLLYLGAPDREFIGRAQLASAVHDWTPSEGRVYPGDSPGGVLLAEVEEWDPPVPMNTVLSQIDPAESAKADFEAGVVRITANEYETALAIAARRPALDRLTGSDVCRKRAYWRLHFSLGSPTRADHAQHPAARAGSVACNQRQLAPRQLLGMTRWRGRGRDGS
jgi:hypothetical protein